MRFDPEKHHRRSIRLAECDYSAEGAYSITVCAQDQRCIFGEIFADEMKLNALGKIVVEEWSRTAEMRPRIRLDAFVVMSNHIHGILVICRGTLQRAPTERFGKPTSDSIPTIIRLFKAAAAKRINNLRQSPGAPVWQRNYYEHIIRDDDEWNSIREYIQTNPSRWAQDRENPGR